MANLIKINFFDPCKIGGADLSITNEFIVMGAILEQKEAIYEQTIEDENGLQVSTFTRVAMKHTLSMLPMPAYMVDLFNLLQYCQTVTITDEDVTYQAHNVEVDIQWVFNQTKALIRMTYDRGAILYKNKCCVSITGDPISDLTIDSVTTTNASGKGWSDASIKVNGSGGVEPYEYGIKIDGEWSLYQLEDTFSDLFAGTYRVRIKDNNGDVYEYPFDILLTQPNTEPPVPMNKHINLDIQFTGNIDEPNSGFTGTINVYAGIGGGDNLVYQKTYGTPRVSVNVQQLAIDNGFTAIKVVLNNFKGYEGGVLKAGYNTIKINNDGTHDVGDAINERETTPITTINNVQVRRHVGEV
jgi:hypothetical protein